MPKDITHWAIASETQKRLSDQRVRYLINTNYATFLVGAVAYDIPYYATGKYTCLLEGKADELHGIKTCNTWQPIIRLLQSYDITEDNSSWETILAFVLGCITHITIDSQYHPFIYYFTGNSYDSKTSKRNQAIFKHRQLESHLDLYYWRKLEYDGPTNSKVLVEQLHRPTLLRILALLYFGKEGDEQRNIVANCLDTYVKVQGMFNNAGIRYVLNILGLGSAEMKKLSALFYPKSVKPVYYRLFEHNSEYRHPSSGELVEASLDTIYKNCIDFTLSKLSRFSPCITLDEYVKVIQSFSSISLETGSECTIPTLMRYFA